MNLLTTIYRNENVNVEAKTFFREAVRGIVFREHKLLMIHSTVKGDYKFPGGGREIDEPYLETLRRELCEEAGARLLNVRDQFGTILEYDQAQEKDFETFKMLSYYYLCHVAEELAKPKLDGYEERLGFHPVWVGVEEALKTNQALFNKRNPVPQWTKRENFVLEMLLKEAS